MTTRTMTRASRTRRVRPWVEQRPVLSFVLLTYAISWPFFVVANLGGGMPAAVVGGLGPPLAAVLLTRYSGGDVRALLRGLLRWRVPARFYAYALGLPVVLYAAVNVVLLISGRELAPGLLLERVPGIIGTFLLVGTLGGGLEEVGWRGHALPRLQQTRSPVRSTLLVGFAWGLWHVPLYGTPAAVVVPTVLAFFYTWLYNRTGSILLCLLLHAGITPAQDFGILLPADALQHTGLLDVTDIAVLGVYVGGAIVLTLVTRGRLGSRASSGTSTTLAPVPSRP